MNEQQLKEYIQDREVAVKAFIDRLPDNQPGIALDIGANHGLYTNLIAQKFEHCFAFECEPENLKKLEKNITQPNITIVPKAVGRVNGKVKLYRTPYNEGGHSTCDTHPQIQSWGHSFDNFIWVSSVTLDSWYKNHILSKNVKFIKCDIEGAENFVFLYGKKLFQENKLTMIIEVHRTVDLDRLYDLFTIELGYNVFYIADTPPLYKSGDTADLFGYDVHYEVTNER